MNTFDKFEESLKTVYPIASESGKKEEYENLNKILVLGKDTKLPLAVAVCGEFKRGKSSLVNAILKQNVCPVADGIATASVSIIRYGAIPKAKRFFSVVTKDGDDEKITTEEEVIDFKSVSKYSRGSSLELDNTMYLEIELPAEALAGGLVLIDTPGIGSLDPRHLLLTRQALPKADAVLFVSDMTEPMMTTELDFIKECILPANKPWAVALCKSDMVTPDERETYRRERAVKISDGCGVQVDCIPVSSKLWREYNDSGEEKKKSRSNCEALMEVISSFYLKRSKTFEEQFRRGFCALAAEIRGEMETSVKELSEVDVQSSKNEYLSQIDELRKLKNDILNPNSDFREGIEKIINDSQEKIYSDFSRDSVLLSIDKLDDILKTPEALKEGGGEYVVEKLNGEIIQIGSGIDRAIDSAIEKAVKECSAYISGFTYSSSHFRGGIDCEVSPVTHTLSENFMSLTRSSLPFLGVSTLGAVAVGSVLSAPVAAAVGISAGLYYVYQTIKGTRRAETVAAIRKQVTPRINVALQELRSYIQKRYSQFNKELIRAMKAAAESVDAKIQEKIKLLNEVQNNSKERSSAIAELNRKINLLKTLEQQVKVYGTNPFGK